MGAVGPTEDDLTLIALYDAQRGILARDGHRFRRLPEPEPFRGSPFADTLARLDGPDVGAFTADDRPRLTEAGEALLREVTARRDGGTDR